MIKSILICQNSRTNSKVQRSRAKSQCTENFKFAVPDKEESVQQTFPTMRHIIFASGVKKRANESGRRIIDLCHIVFKNNSINQSCKCYFVITGQVSFSKLTEIYTIARMNTPVHKKKRNLLCT